MTIEYSKYITLELEDESLKDKVFELLDEFEPYACIESAAVTDKMVVKNLKIFEELIKLNVTELYTKPYNDNFYFIQDSEVKNDIVRW